MELGPVLIHDMPHGATRILGCRFQRRVLGLQEGEDAVSTVADALLVLWERTRSYLVAPLSFVCCWLLAARSKSDR